MTDTKQITEPLREAQKNLSIALSRMSDLGPGSKRLWVGAWGEYQDLARLMVKTMHMADNIERLEAIHIKRLQREVKNSNGN